MSTVVVDRERSRWRHRVIALGALSVLAGAVAGGVWATRPRPRSLVFPPSDPNTGCGAVSLALVGHWLGASRSIAELNGLTRSHDSGIASLFDLKDAAREMGLDAEAVRLDPSRPIPWRQPTILYLHGNHFVATLPIDGDHLVFVDPPRAPDILDRRRLAGDWEGVSLILASSQADLEGALAKADLPMTSR